MTKRLWLVVALMVVVAGLSACSYFGQDCGHYQHKVERTSNLWAADREVGLATADDRCIPLSQSPLMAQYGRTINKTEGFFGTYFFNYDLNDPYRGDDLGEMGSFVGTHLLMYPSCDPYRGDCMGCGYYCPAPVYNSPSCCGPR